MTFCREIIKDKTGKRKFLEKPKYVDILYYNFSTDLGHSENPLVSLVANQFNKTIKMGNTGFSSFKSKLSWGK